MNLLPLPALTDNYIWLPHNGSRALVVDPGESGPVAAALQQYGLQLEGILVTHHHGDHTAGIGALHAQTGAAVFGPATEAVFPGRLPLNDGDQVDLLGLHFAVMHVPGHTAGHLAYFAPCPGEDPLLFCGDTLFSAGCGRLFEGTPAQMLQSLERLAALPPSTRVCCTHEYTLGNLRFARAVEPDNAALRDYQARCEALRERALPTLPSSIDLERRINPFLRTREAAVLRAAQQREPAVTDAVGVFAAIRQWKNDFS